MSQIFDTGRRVIYRQMIKFIKFAISSDSRKYVVLFGFALVDIALAICIWQLELQCAMTT